MIAIHAVHCAELIAISAGYPPRNARAATQELTSLSRRLSTSFSLKRLTKMCNYTKNYYIYFSCQDPGAHFFKCSTDGRKDKRCPKGPHERYVVQPGACPLCGSNIDRK